jgi:hypothetical protein
MGAVDSRFPFSLNPAVWPRAATVPSLPAASSNCGADHLLGDNRFPGTSCGLSEIAGLWPRQPPHLGSFQARNRRLRPFIVGGVGAKDYAIAGPEPFPQPIPQIATLTTNDVWKVVFVPGGGVQYLLRPHMLLRAELRDYITTFPRTQIVPAPRNTARGIFQQFTPLFGVSYAF